MNLENPQQRLIAMFGGFALLIVLGLGILNLALDATQGIITLKTAPADSVLMLDGKQISNNGSMRVQPGDHELKASRTGFADKTTKFSIKAGERQTHEFYMSPNSDIGRQWMRDNPEQAAEIEGAGGREFDKRNEEVSKKYPILKELPFTGRTFNIDYGKSIKNPNDPTAVALYVQGGSEEDYAEARAWIEYWGYNPADFEIIYR